jgi:hypoxanthine phosphoribosyltransferase
MNSHQGQIRRISWQAIQLWIRELADDQTEWDCIVGVSRGGVPLAVSLSYYCDRKQLEFLHRSQAPGPRPPFYLFGDSREDRIDKAMKNFHLTGGGKYRHVLVIDDVATFGDTLAVAGELLTAEGVTDIKFATYAADLTVLKRERPDLASRLRYGIAIDNSSTWLSFPWQSHEDLLLELIGNRLAHTVSRSETRCRGASWGLLRER